MEIKLPIYNALKDACNRGVGRSYNNVRTKYNQALKFCFDRRQYQSFIVNYHYSETIRLTRNGCGKGLICYIYNNTLRNLRLNEEDLLVSFIGILFSEATTS